MDPSTNYPATPSAPEETPTILVEFAPRSGLQQVALTPADVVEKSREALDQAMTTVEALAKRFRATVDNLVVPPTEVSLQFGLKLDAEAGALIAQAGVEASMSVTLSWKKEDDAVGG